MFPHIKKRMYWPGDVVQHGAIGLIPNTVENQTKKSLHHNQEGYAPGMQGWFNIRDSI